MKRAMFVALLALSAAGCSTTPVQRTADFERADLNQDGKIEIAEWLRFGGAEASFLAADTARKGKLDEAQFRQALRLNDEATGNSTRQQKTLDSQIQSDARRALEQSRDVNGWNITIEVYQGNLTLSGPVRSLKEKQAAEQIVSGVLGVKAVFNQLVIRQ